MHPIWKQQASADEALLRSLLEYHPLAELERLLMEDLRANWPSLSGADTGTYSERAVRVHSSHLHHGETYELTTLSMVQCPPRLR